MAKPCVSVCLFVLSLFGSAALAQNTATVPHQPPAFTSSVFATMNIQARHEASNRMSASANAMSKNQDPRIVTLPNFSSSFTFGGQTFPFTMVGRDPSRRKTTVIPTQYISLSFSFDEFVDANGNNIVIDNSPIGPILFASPLFNNFTYQTGFTQYEDSVMRAEFFPLFNKDGDNDHDDNYHVLLAPPVSLIPVTIEVPVGSAVAALLPDGTFVAEIDINYISDQLNTLFQTEPIDPRAIPIFIGRNVVYGDFVNQQPVDCCIGGFHSAFVSNQTPEAIFVQTFTFATWLQPDISEFLFGDPTIFADIEPISHEIGETFNDPFVNNIVPNYQLPGFPVGTCQNLLEVGDVVEATPNPSFPITLNGFTYHPQTLGLLQWFEGLTPSNAFNGDYSFPGNNLTSPFQPCPTGP